MSDKKCYELPLAPQDLVSIYKDKEEIEDFVLWVNYLESKKKLSAKHIIIYLANTNFKTTFSAVDDDLIIEYIKSDFMVDSPLLARIIVMIIKCRLQHDLNNQEKELLVMYPEENIHRFIKENMSLVDELIDVVGSSVPFVISKFYEGLTEEQKELEFNLKELLNDIEVVDKPINCGPNIARLLTVGYDAFLLVISKYGFNQTYNKQIYNDQPKYFGKDLYYVLCQTNITDNILSFLPPDFIIANDSTAE